MSEQAEQAKPVFPPPQNTPKCTWQECSNGHKSPARLAVIKCQGCGSDVVANLLTNCPICNDVIVSVAFPMHRIVADTQITPVCRGVQPAYEATQISIGFEMHKEFEVRGEAPSEPEVVYE